MKRFAGKVLSVKMQKTVVIEKKGTKVHPLYKKILRVTKKIKAHSELELAVGDMVEAEAVRPISKDVHFKVTKKL